LGRSESAWSVFHGAALYLLALMMVCDFLCATSIVTWIARLFEETFGNRRLYGGSALSASSAGVCLGRIAMGFLPPGRVSDRVLLAVCYLVGVGCFFVILWFRPPFVASLALMALSGAMFAAQSPAMSSLAVKEFGSLAPVAIPLYEAVGNVAGVAGPWLLGGLLDAGADLGTALYLPPAAGVVLAIVALSWEAQDRRSASGTPSAIAEPVELG
jgi:predicted MFS family arabinose efflux permease